jgi:hypothetical protein
VQQVPPPSEEQSSADQSSTGLSHAAQMAFREAAHALKQHTKSPATNFRLTGCRSCWLVGLQLLPKTSEYFVNMARR